MAGPRSSARILVVEDDPKTAELVALYLRNAGHRVEVEHAGDRALARLTTERFDLLVLDVMLPGVDGLELCRRARAQGGTGGGVGVVLVTARTREEERIAGLELGADDYLSKPFSPRELTARVNAVLRRVKSRAQLLELLPGGPCETLDRTVDAHIKNLRRKLAPEAATTLWIETVVGAGYRFAATAGKPAA